MNSNDSVVITGIGPICSLGIGAEKVMTSLRKNNSNFVNESFFVDNEHWEDFQKFQVPNFNISDFNLDVNVLNEIRTWKQGVSVIDLDYFFGAIKLALDDARIISNDNQDRKIGIVLAHENICFFPFVEKMCEVSFKALSGKKNKKINFYKEIFKECSQAGYDVQSFVTLFQITKLFRIHGISLFINNACASGLYALETGAQLIRSGQVDVVIVAAADYADFFKYLWFKNLNFSSKDNLIRPFCKLANGFVLGDGAAALVLERKSQATKKIKKIYAEYLGGGFALDGWKMTMPNITGESYKNAITNALSASKCSIDDISLICPHGIGLPITDYYEAKALYDVFSRNLTKTKITALKPYIGHTLGASSLLETAILLISMAENFIPATLNHVQAPNKIKIIPTTQSEHTKINTYIKTCCAFGGFNAAAVFRRID